MKSIRELELQYYLNNDIDLAKLYALVEDTQIQHFVDTEAYSIEIEQLHEDINAISEDLEESDTILYKLKGRVEELEWAKWRLDELEK